MKTSPDEPEVRQNVCPLLVTIQLCLKMHRDISDE